MRWPDHPRVDLVTTDGFLYPNAVLEARGLMSRKGFPESYDVRRLLQFLAELKAGEPVVRAPVYSHLTYDIVAGDEIVLRSPDIVIVEGLNVLQAPARRGRTEPTVVVSDFFDFTIYVDAERRATSSSGTSTGSCCCARPRCTIPSRSSTSSRSTPRTTRARSAQYDLARGQRGEPAREHRADAGSRAPRAREGRRPPRAPRAPPSSSESCERFLGRARRAGRTTRARRSSARARSASTVRRLGIVATRAGRPTRPCRRARSRAPAGARRMPGSRSAPR